MQRQEPYAVMFVSIVFWACIVAVFAAKLVPMISADVCQRIEEVNQKAASKVNQP